MILAGGARRLFFFLAATLVAWPAQASWQWNERATNAWHLIWQYRLSEAEALLEQETRQNETNGIGWYLRGRLAFIRAMVTDTEDHRKAFDEEYEQCLKKLALAGNKGPWYYYLRGELKLYSGFLDFKSGNYVNGARTLYGAWGSFQASQKADKNFLPVKKNIFFIRLAAASVPEKYTFVVRGLGFSTDKSNIGDSLRMLVQRMQADNFYQLFAQETQVVLAYSNLYVHNRPEAAWQQMQQATADHASVGGLSRFFRAQLALRLRKGEEAIATLAPLEQQPPAIYHLDYLYGDALLQRLDLKGAEYLARYLRHYKGQAYVKDAWLKLGWAFLLAGNQKNYAECMAMVKSQGSTALEEDKNAELEAGAETTPALPLLRARLLFDGGYFRRAQEELEQVSPTALNLAQRQEYYYRMGRIRHELKNYKEALWAYRQAREVKPETSYFAPASCLYMGQVHEAQGNKKEAARWYRLVFSYQDYPYQGSMEQRAKAGLKRVE